MVTSAQVHWLGALWASSSPLRTLHVSVISTVSEPPQARVTSPGPVGALRSSHQVTRELESRGAPPAQAPPRQPWLSSTGMGRPGLKVLTPSCRGF